MNKLFFIPAICAAFVLSSCGGSSKVEESGKVAEASAVALTYEIDSASSNVVWLAKKEFDLGRFCNALKEEDAPW